MLWIRMSVLLLLVIGILAGCKSNSEKFPDNYKLGIIETTGQDNKSVITYYDQELKKVYTQKLPFGTMGSIFYSPIIFDNKLYTIPQGMANEKDLKMVLEVDLSNGNAKEYSINQLAMNSLAVNSDYIFTCNTYNGTSYINRCEKQSKAVLEKDFADTYISKLELVGNKLLAFGTKREESLLASYLYFLDLDLKVLKTINISRSGSSHYKTVLIGEKVYFSNPMDRYDQANTLISSVSTQNLNVENIDLEQVYPSDIIPYNNYLIIAHCNLVSHEGNLITFYDTKKDSIETISLTHPILQMSRDLDNLYIMDQEKLYRYKINGTGLELTKEIPINTRKNSKVFYYVSGFFLKQ